MSKYNTISGPGGVPLEGFQLIQPRLRYRGRKLDAKKEAREYAEWFRALPKETQRMLEELHESS